MNLIHLTENMAKEIFNWRYDGEYSVYDMPDWDIAKKSNFGITISETREKEFLGLIDKDNNLIGFIRLREVDGNVVIGLGLKPNLCGKGIGSRLMELIKSESSNKFKNKKIRLEVRSFNKRAIKCYEKAGFKIVNVHNRDTKRGNLDFVVMEY